MKSFRYFCLLVVGCILATLSACQQPVVYGPRLTPEEIKAEEIRQKQLVEAAAESGGAPRPWRNRPSMRKQFGNVADHMEPATAQVCKELGLPKLKRRCYYYFVLSTSRDINASSDGKNIIVDLGMMRFIENDDELAAIMGHELAHNLMGHLEAQRENELAGKVIGYVADAIATSQGMNTKGGFADTGADLGRVSYSVEFEKEADYVGLYIAARAGYNINRIAEFWRRMTLEDPDGIYGTVTHPSNPERFVALQKTIDEINYKRTHHIPLLPDLKKDVTNAM